MAALKLLATRESQERSSLAPDELIEINRTDQPWNKRSAAVA